MARIAFLFPGQGSQSKGMLSALAAEWPCIQETFDVASNALGYDLWQIACSNEDGKLDQTTYTQPAMLAAGVAVGRVWQAAGGPPAAAVAGHSLGEYSALVAAGALDFADAVRLVARRGHLMQAAIPQGEGGMAAILGLDDSSVIDICSRVTAERIVEPVNFNAPGQVVIAGHADAVAQAIELASAEGAKRAVRLPVSVPAHSSLMRDAAAQLATSLAEVEFSAPNIPIVHNVDTAEHPTSVQIRDALERHLYNPVRWSESVEMMHARGTTTFVELGPGRVLSGLTRRINRACKGLPVDDPATLAKALNDCKPEEE